MSTRPKIRCPHCNAIFEARTLVAHRKYRNKYGIDVFGCPECSKTVKFDPRDYLFASQQVAKGEAPEGMAVGAVAEHDLLPSEQMAIDEGGKPSSRYVPMTIGVVSIAGALFVIVYFSGWWKLIPAMLLLAFGWASLKTSLFASDQEIAQLAGDEPMSNEAAKKFKDRV